MRFQKAGAGISGARLICFEQARPTQTSVDASDLDSFCHADTLENGGKVASGVSSQSVGLVGSGYTHYDTIPLPTQLTPTVIAIATMKRFRLPRVLKKSS